MANNTHARVAQ